MPVTEKNLEINISKTVVMAATISSEEIQTINRIPESSNDDFFQLIFEFLLNPSDSSKLLNKLELFCNGIGASSGGVKSLVKSLLSFLKDGLKNNVSTSHLKDQLERLGK